MRALAGLLARELLRRPPQHRGALVVGLVGDLGAGKTTFVQGFAQGAGIRRRLVSPTFIIFRRYPLRKKRFDALVHVDAYRITKRTELRPLGFQSLLADSRALVIVEWADHIRASLPKDILWVRFDHAHDRMIRTVHIGP